MALLISPGTRVFDASGNPIAGKVRVYNANTTTLSTLYSDTGLTVPLTNPVTCNSSGYPSSNGTAATGIFCASANYDVAFLDASSVVMATIDDVAAYASSGTGVDLTLAGGTRYTVTDSAGRVLIQVGDASPDNVGGKLTIEGYAGTQADDVLIDAALFDTTGRIKEIGKKLTGIVQTDATSFSSSAGVVIDLPNSPTGVRGYRIDIWDLQGAGAGAHLTGTLSYDGGGSYKSGASDYNWVNMRTDHTFLATDNTSIASEATAGAEAKLILAFNLRTLANRSAWATIEILTPDSGSEHTLVRARTTSLDSGSATYMMQTFTTNEAVGGYGRATNLKILQAANLISGKYRVEVLRGFGET